MPSIEDIFADPEKAGKIASVEGRVTHMLATNPPDPSRFSRNILICYFLDPPDEGATDVECENCGSAEKLGPKSTKMRSDNPGLFHVLCGICGLAVTKIRVDMGGEPQVHNAKNWRPFG